MQRGSREFLDPSELLGFKLLLEAVASTDELSRA
jgi:hypothetical protein